MTRFTAVPAALAAFLSAAISSAEAGPYTLLDLGALVNDALPTDPAPPFRSSSANAINNNGFVAGSSVGGAFLYVPGTPAGVLQIIPGSGAGGINEAGQVAGSNGTSASLYSPGQGSENLGVLPGDEFSYGTAVNNAGQVVGGSENFSTGDIHAFLYTPGSGMQNITGDINVNGNPALYALGFDINDQGQMTGWAYDEIGGGGIVYDTVTGTTTALGDLPGGSIGSEGRAINELGQVVGGSYRDAGGKPRALLFTDENGDGTYEILNIDQSLISGTSYGSIAYGLNDIGQVVGDYWATAGSFLNTAFLYTRSTDTMVDLNTLLLPEFSGLWHLSTAYDINNAGQIVGVGIYDDGTVRESRAFLLNPQAAAVPEPGTLALLATGGLGLVGGWCRKRRTPRPA